ncbi:MAG TPA: hypothetical protein PLL09_03915 [Flavobacterium sp.]|uniref:hypothetical protein n=2 Tax=Flavobacterium TaxID=237 RepID=UPI0025C037C7|nr:MULTISPECIES: hypothetical protein [unclassified Flavobacterium]HRE76952.1 hypothetical protein [Flavobacterium sp.]
MHNTIDQINKLHEKALEEKRIACKSDLSVENFKTASVYYNDLVNYINEVIALNVDDVNLNLQLTITKEYGLFQVNECLYGFLFRKGKYDRALEIARLANDHIQKLLKIIELNYDTANEKAKDYIDRGKIDWKLSSLTIKIKLLEPIARKSMQEEKFVNALDHYKKINDLHEINHRYIMENEVDLVLKRTELGNYYSAKAGVANSLGAIYVLKSGDQDYFIEILEQFMNVIQFLKLAQNNNPEQDKFKDGIIAVTNSIKVLLNENKNKWFEYIIYFKNDKTLELIMRQTDNENYKMLNAKLEIEKDKPKRIILTFGFLLCFFLIIAHTIFQIAVSEINWFRFIILIFALPLFFTVIGAFALRSTESLKEENFLKLMKLAFKINVKGLKIFSEKGS